MEKTVKSGTGPTGGGGWAGAQKKWRKAEKKEPTRKGEHKITHGQNIKRSPSFKRGGGQGTNSLRGKRNGGTPEKRGGNGKTKEG